MDNQFQSANPSIVKSIRQRELLNAWLRALRKPKPLPSLLDFKPDRINDDELADMMGFNVEGDGETARYVITHEGTRLTATYGNEHVDPAERTNRYLDDAIGPDRYARVVPSYRACIALKRPTYSVAMVRDPDGKDVSYERLLLPFGPERAGRADRRFLQGDQHRRRLQSQQSDGAQAQQHSGRRHQRRHRSGHRAPAGHPAGRCGRNRLAGYFFAVTSSPSLPWHRSPA